MHTSSEVSQAENSDWRRVSPWSVIHFLWFQLKHTVSFAIYIVPAYLVGGHKLLDSQWLPLVVLGLGCGLLVVAVLRFLFFQFCITAQGISIRSGVFDRTFTDLPFERIQNIKFDQPIYFRPKDLLIVTLDTAGSSKQEAQFVGVSDEYARHIKTTIMQARANRQQELPQAATPVDANQEGEVLNRRTIGDLVLHGITNNRMWILLGTLAPFYDQISSFIFSQMNRLRPQVEALLGEQAVALWYVGVMTLLIAVLLIILMALFSIAGSILMFYGYTLSKHDNKYVRRSGLLNRQEVSMKQSRVQIARQQQDWLDRILGRVNLFFEQNVTGQQVQNELKATNKLLIPSVTVDEADILTRDVFASQQVRHADFHPIDVRYLWRQCIFWLLPLNAAVSASLIFNLQHIGVLPAVLLMAVSATLTVLHYKRWGISSDEQYVYVRKGTIGIDYWCFPLAKTQQIIIKQNILMRQRKLVTLEFVLASGKVKVPFVPEQVAAPLVQKILHEVEVNKPAWM
ncbi:PH domain-containing protein [Alteromonas gilva]|uniref:PH domain-containing protein n=1 Tax=Alteromonas gilva TaxID=2987522 RepID=A0ABT5L809_9ALTE|nr:PH domain-containing protein [Alteromonas gilva]MDC8832536.1 PH domain-containing protein [Alteromonas gilva]